MTPVYISVCVPKREIILVQPFTQTIQNNKCPHGFIVGTCPICSGMGSRASSDRNKPRKKGEMSYNECLAQWNAIKAKKQQKLNERKEALAQLNNTLPKDKTLSNINKLNSFFKVISNNINNAPLIIKAPSKFISNIVLNSFNFVKNTFVNVSKMIGEGISKTLNFINSTAEKLSSFLGEAKNFVNEKVLKGLKEALLKDIKTILSLNSQKGEKENENRKKVELKKIKKVIRKKKKKRE